MHLSDMRTTDVLCYYDGPMMFILESYKSLFFGYWKNEDREGNLITYWYLPYEKHQIQIAKDGGVSLADFIRTADGAWEITWNGSIPIKIKWRPMSEISDEELPDRDVLI